MSRNPMAGSLKHFRQRIVPDKREASAVEMYERVMRYHPETLQRLDDEGDGGTEV